jgi:photosystem II stability/assembly factor-like uncharacterized protein
MCYFRGRIGCIFKVLNGFRMKIFHAILFYLCFSVVSYGQVWDKYLPENKKATDLRFSDYQNAFNAYLDVYQVVNGKYTDRDGQNQRAGGWKQFKRWEWFIESQVDRKTGAFPVISTDKIIANVNLLKKAPNKTSSAIWTSMGPNQSEGGYAGIGRLNCIAFHPNDTNTYWVGAPSGGLWKTSNNGSSWVCLTDGIKVMGVSSILIPSDYLVSQTIYIATGDRDNFDTRSIGILKSTDGGQTWNKTGLTYELAQNAMVTQMLLNPADNNQLMAATNLGLFYSNDGANTFARVNSVPYIDIDARPGSFDFFYASRTTGRIDTVRYNGQGWQSGISRVFPTGRRVEMAVCPTEPMWIYAIVANAEDGLLGIYKSENGGISFTEKFSGLKSNLLGWDAEGKDKGGQGRYDLSIIVSPDDASVVFIGGINSWKSIDGGSTWKIVNHRQGNLAQAVHADKHNFAFRSDGTLFELNDGGIYKSTNAGESGSWVDLTNGMVISQIYKLGVSKASANEVITGLMDNGTKLYKDGVWTDVGPGDGMECIIDYTNPHVQYFSSYYGGIYRTDNRWASFKKITPRDDKGNDLIGSWITPYLMHPDDNKTLYAGYNAVYRTFDQGETWTVISDFNSANKIRTLAICEYDANTIYAADLGNLWKSADGGSTWVEKKANLPNGGNILGLHVKPDNPQMLWLCLGSYENDAVYQSTDGGNTWQSISSGLPNQPVRTIVYNKLEQSKIDLYAGTESGVYYKSGNQDWVYYGKGLPNVIVTELEIDYNTTNPRQSKLLAATYGRGLWSAPLVTPDNFPPDISGIEVSSIKDNSAILSANLNNPFGSELVESGFIYSHQSYPVLGAPFSYVLKTDPIVSSGVFQLPIYDILFPFYVRPYAISDYGIAYGRAKAFDKEGYLLDSNNTLKKGFNIFPNPSQGKFILSVESFVNDMHFSVKDIAGRTLYKQHILQKRTAVKLPDLKAGIYIAELKWPAGLFVSKLLIHK